MSMSNGEVLYRVRLQNGPQEMERNEAAARHTWAKQHAWLLLSFFPFHVGHPMSAGCKGKLLFQCKQNIVLDQMYHPVSHCSKECVSHHLLSSLKL